VNLENPNNFLEIWNKNDPLKPEPTSAYIFVGAMIPWMNAPNENHPPCCGSAFGYKKYRKGQIPEKVYGWRGDHAIVYPYDYTDRVRYGGFNSTPSYTDAMMLPNACLQGLFTQTDFIPPDAVNHAIGNWDKVFNGGKGHWFARSTPPSNFTGHDGCGSSASIFGPGHDGGQYPAGSGGPGTDTARGPVAKGLAPGILVEMGLYRNFIWGKSRTWNTEGDAGDFEIHLPPNLFMFGQGPIAFSDNLLSLPPVAIPPDRLRNTVPDQPGTHAVYFSVMLEYR